MDENKENTEKIIRISDGPWVCLQKTVARFYFTLNACNTSCSRRKRDEVGHEHVDDKNDDEDDDELTTANDQDGYDNDVYDDDDNDDD